MGEYCRLNVGGSGSSPLPRWSSEHRGAAEMHVSFHFSSSPASIIARSIISTPPRWVKATTVLRGAPRVRTQVR